MIPKALRDRLGLVAGSTAKLVRRSGKLGAVSTKTVTDQDMFALIDAGRR